MAFRAGAPDRAHIQMAKSPLTLSSSSMDLLGGLAHLFDRDRVEVSPARRTAGSITRLSSTDLSPVLPGRRCRPVISSSTSARFLRARSPALCPYLSLRSRKASISHRSAEIGCSKRRVFAKASNATTPNPDRFSNPVSSILAHLTNCRRARGLQGQRAHSGVQSSQGAQHSHFEVKG
jgi:hypothetical protein